MLEREIREMLFGLEQSLTSRPEHFMHFAKGSQKSMIILARGLGRSTEMKSHASQGERSFKGNRMKHQLRKLAKQKLTKSLQGNKNRRFEEADTSTKHR